MVEGGWRPARPATRMSEEHAATDNVIILGSGIAGLTAAVYTARGGLAPLVVDGAEPGGQLSLTSVVENFPGFPDGVGGLDLVQAIRAQAERFGARFIPSTVSRVRLDAAPYAVELDEEASRYAHSVIIASGARARLLGMPAEAELLGRGLSVCATCDGALFRGRKVAVIGGGDSAMEDAVYLTKFASEIHVVHRRDAFRASRIMQERARAKPSIQFHWNRQVVQYLKDSSGGLAGVRLSSTDGSEVYEDLLVDGVFLAIGHVPNTEMLAGQLPVDNLGYLQPDGVRTALPGVFVAGDVADRRYQQAATAAGSGCAAGMEAEWYLEEHGLYVPTIAATR